MNSGAFFLANYLSIVCLVVWFPLETSTCDTKWIRLVYMMSCGKKKRESVSVRNNGTFYEDLPGDFDRALKYFRDRDPFHSMLSNDAYLYRILEEDEKSFRLHSHVPKLLGNVDPTRSPTETSSSNPTTKKSSILINKLLVKMKSGNNLGIRGFPEQWDIEEIFDEKINENHRREIDRLIEECCKVPPVITCNANTFLGACK